MGGWEGVRAGLLLEERLRVPLPVWLLLLQREGAAVAVLVLQALTDREPLALPRGLPESDTEAVAEPLMDCSSTQ